MNATKICGDRIGNVYRRPGLRVFPWRFKSGRHHPNYCVGVAAQRNSFTQDVLIAAELTLPQRMAEHDHKRAASFVIVRSDVATALRIDTQGLEVCAADLAHLN